jgi:hypothetical protein
MNPEIISELAGLVGVMIPVLALSIGGLLVLSRTRVGDAFARRIAGDSHHPECESQIVAIQNQVDVLQSQLNDTQERLDFAERLLTNVAEAGRGIAGGGS